MKKILFVDDDNYKVKDIKTFLEEQGEYNIIIVNALNPGLRTISLEDYDFVILDMSLPTFNASENKHFKPFGGLDFLKEMKRKKNNTPVVIVTQYELFGEGKYQKTADAIDMECCEKFSNYRGIIIYSSTKKTWKEKLIGIIGG